ncbi:la-related protein 7 isoform X2 [Parasteatoda tepidariorum]|uniref:la-related protein 7 isoform X2 n=1 Tax=Parasteatoda tepidariorum TaxID=114398 RepID=UPI00077FB0EA|nr:la-related protein 7 isoform X2 [Parasteatoda tepidariorum]
MIMEIESSETVVTELSGRKKKKLFVKLRTQMEFYFSDSNLAKDKFLYNLISQDEDGYVDLEVFKSFNKIKALSEDMHVLAASLSKSSILELNENKSRVRRRTSIQMSKDFDACTLYVEGLPHYADLKWIKNVFDHFGTVEYINIPRFNVSHKIKGFAFIEFSNPESVKKACQFYKNSTDLENGSSKKESSDLKEISEEVKPTAEVTNKRKLEDNEDSGVTLKKPKIDEENLKTLESDIKNKQAGDEKINEDNSSQDSSKLQENNISAQESTVEEPSSKSKKKRSHSKKNHNRHERPTLRVMSKSEWKAYRNKYLDLQRTTMSYLKKQILLECQEMREQETEPIPKKELKFQPGVILKILLANPIENSTEMKEQIKACTVVAYIDAPMGSEEVFIRCNASEDAKSIIQDKKLHHLGNIIQLSGKDEEEYWKKIESDREAKLNNPVVRKHRGRDKLISKAAKLVQQRNKHMYFDE